MTDQPTAPIAGANSQLDKFEYQQPTEEQTERIKALRQSFRDLNRQIENLIPASQERSLAVTNLRQAMMWANAGIVFNGGRPEPQP
jgi:K+-sensing histidine kinase KdpD